MVQVIDFQKKMFEDIVKINDLYLCFIIFQFQIFQVKYSKMWDKLELKFILLLLPTLVPNNQRGNDMCLGNYSNHFMIYAKNWDLDWFPTIQMVAFILLMTIHIS
jgi:hypothetical protein